MQLRSPPSYYTYNPHTDVQAITDATGNTKATYGYTAYGADDTSQDTGIDKTTGTGSTTPTDTKQPYNPYRFNHDRIDPTTTAIDTGFRTYDPSISRFLTRDMYQGALADQNLTADPYTGNPYAFAAGNPITNIELDGHRPMCDSGECPSSVIQTWQKAQTKASSTPQATPNCWGPGGEYLCGEQPKQGQAAFDYSLILAYMVTLMNEHSTSADAGAISKGLNSSMSCSRIITVQVCVPDIFAGVDWTAAMEKFASLERQGGSWDQKPILKKMFGMTDSNLDTEYSNIPGTGLRINYDIWANIHYGYVGSAAGISKKLLLSEQNLPTNPVTGRPDPADAVSVQIGIDLYNKYGAGNLTNDEVNQAIVDAIPTYRYVDRNAVHPHVLPQI